MTFTVFKLIEPLIEKRIALINAKRAIKANFFFTKLINLIGLIIGTYINIY